MISRREYIKTVVIAGLAGATGATSLSGMESNLFPPENKSKFPDKPEVLKFQLLFILEDWLKMNQTDKRKTEEGLIFFA